MTNASVSLGDDVFRIMYVPITTYFYDYRVEYPDNMY